MGKKFDIWDEHNELLEEAYRRNNYLVYDYNNSDICYIFCASNDIYYPNEEEVFCRTILKNDRFEWNAISKSKQIIKSAGRVILIRDVYKQWYITGLNNKCNNPKKMLDLLKSLTEGYRVITAGVSAGGYVAALIGSVLNAERCFDFSGQNTLAGVIDDFCFRITGENKENLPYYDLRESIEKSSCVFWYFYPYYFEKDKNEYQHISDLPNVRGMAFNQAKHAATVMASSYKFIISKDKNFLDRNYKKHNGHIINFVMYFFETVPMRCWIPLGIKETKAFIIRRRKAN